MTVNIIVRTLPIRFTLKATTNSVGINSRGHPSPDFNGDVKL